MGKVTIFSIYKIIGAFINFLIPFSEKPQAHTKARNRSYNAFLKNFATSIN